MVPALCPFSLPFPPPFVLPRSLSALGGGRLERFPGNGVGARSLGDFLFGSMPTF